VPARQPLRGRSPELGRGSDGGCATSTPTWPRVRSFARTTCRHLRGLHHSNFRARRSFFSRSKRGGNRCAKRTAASSEERPWRRSAEFVSLKRCRAGVFVHRTSGAVKEVLCGRTYLESRG